ncbi:MAG TPA: SDR family NAD(P)-dependent oxidoreductase [Micromonosporaceae bacterium]
MSAGFTQRYGPWAVVAGASVGLGAAFATELASRGLNLILVARRHEPLAQLASALPTRTITVAADLATMEGIEETCAAAAEVEVGLVVANAAYAPIGAFLTLDPAQVRQAVELNCLAPMWLAQRLLPPMVARGRGGFVVMSSLAGLQGTAPIAVYAATKAFGAVFAEGLWAQLRGTGVDVVTCLAGAVQTPGLAATKARRAPGTLPAAAVVRAALGGLGRGPRVVPGPLMRVSALVMSRLLPRRTAISMISRASGDLTPPPVT